MNERTEMIRRMRANGKTLAEIQMACHASYSSIKKVLSGYELPDFVPVAKKVRATPRRAAYFTVREMVQPCSQKELEEARDRPNGCSIPRWRIELGRRVLAKAGALDYAMMPEGTPIYRQW